MVFKQRTFILGEETEDDDADSVDNDRPMLGHLIIFSPQQLRTATNDFSSQCKVGKGGFGTVYRGVLPDGSIVAVKRMANQQRWRREIEIGMMARHPSLLCLIGFSFAKEEKCVVYPLIEGGSVASHLKDLDWVSRNNIALGVARGLSHLHDHCSWRIVHSDVNPANILLGDNFQPLLADFGNAQLMVKKLPQEEVGAEESVNAGNNRITGKKEEEEEEEQRRRSGKQRWGVSCSYWTNDDTGSYRPKGLSCWYWSNMQKKQYLSLGLDLEDLGLLNVDEDEVGYESERVLSSVRGTVGYIAPEYYSQLRISEKSDVFGYGATILDLVRGKRVHELMCDGRVFTWENERKDIMERLMNVNDDHNKVMLEMNMMKVALLCIQTIPERRPVMAEVITMLEMGNNVDDALDSKWQRYCNDVIQDEIQDDWLNMSSPIYLIMDSTEYQISEELSSPR